MIRRRRLLIVAVIVGASQLTSPVQAADEGPGINLQISPLPIELVTPPGTSTSSELRVRNAGSQTEQLKVTLKKFRVKDNGEVVIEDRGGDDDYFNWVTFSRSSFPAPPDQWQTVKMTVNVPKSAAFGYYYVVEFSRANPTKAAPGKSAVEGAVGIFVLLEAKVPGALRQADIKEFSADHQFYEYLPARLNVKVANTGNVHLKPHGNIFMQGLRGGTISTLKVNGTGGNVLPRSFRKFESEWTDGFPVYLTKSEDGVPVLDAHGQPQRSLKWDFSQVPKLRIGKYTAKLLMIYDNGQRDVPLTATVSFWVIPWRLLLGLLAVATFAGIGLWSTGRKIAGKLRRRPS